MHQNLNTVGGAGMLCVPVASTLTLRLVTLATPLMPELSLNEYVLARLQLSELLRLLPSLVRRISGQVVCEFAATTQQPHNHDPSITIKFVHLLEFISVPSY